MNGPFKAAKTRPVGARTRWDIVVGNSDGVPFGSAPDEAAAQLLVLQLNAAYWMGHQDMRQSLVTTRPVAPPIASSQGATAKPKGRRLRSTRPRLEHYGLKKDGTPKKVPGRKPGYKLFEDKPKDEQ